MALHLSVTFSTPWLQAYTKASEMTKKKKKPSVCRYRCRASAIQPLTVPLKGTRGWMWGG